MKLAGAGERNARARRAAKEDPITVAMALLDDLHRWIDILNKRWPGDVDTSDLPPIKPLRRDEKVPASLYEFRTRFLAFFEREKAKQSDVWRALEADVLLCTLATAIRANRVREEIGDEAAQNQGWLRIMARVDRSELAMTLCDHLGRLAAGNGLAILTMAVEAIPRETEPNHRERIVPYRHAVAVQDPATASRTLTTMNDGRYPTTEEPDSTQCVFSGFARSGLDMQPSQPEAQQGFLPGFAASDGRSKVAAPFPVLVNHDRNPLLSHSGGRGAPLAFRLYNEVVTSIPANERDGCAKLVSWTLRELAALLWPGSRWFARFGPAIVDAADLVDRAAVVLVGPTGRPGRRHPARIRFLPNGRGPEDVIAFSIQLPEFAVGPKIPRDFLRRMGTRSAPLYRATFSLPYYWDRYGSRNGTLIRHDRLRRDPTTSGLLDAGGSPIHDGKGHLIKKLGKVPIGVEVGREPNPARTRYPALDSAEIGEVFHGPSSGVSKSTMRRRLQIARESALRLEELGYMVLETEDGSPVENWRRSTRVRILPGPIAAIR